MYRIFYTISIIIIGLVSWLSSGSILSADRATTDDFYKLITDGRFVDKTLLIKEYLKTTEQIVLITRPRKFGKTVNIDMLRRFLEIETDSDGVRSRNSTSNKAELFCPSENATAFVNNKRRKRLNICSEESIMRLAGQKPVLYLSFKNVNGSTFAEVESSFKTVISALYKRYRYLLKEFYRDEKEVFASFLTDNGTGIHPQGLERSLVYLCQIVRRHFGGLNVHVLIDDYDVPLANMASNMLVDYRDRFPNSNTTELLDLIFRSDDFNNTYILCQRMFDNFLRYNTAMEKAFICGTLSINLVKDRDNLIQCRSTRYYARTPFDYFYGFLPSEIDRLTDELPYEVNRKCMEEWFKGYSSYNEADDLYNPLSISRYLANAAKLDYYWIEDSPLVERILAADDVQLNIVQRLIDRARVNLSCCMESYFPFDDVTNDNGLYGVLYHTGYLTFRNFSFQLPNLEVDNALQAIALKWVRRKLNVTVEDVRRMSLLLADFEAEKFRREMQDRLSNVSYNVIGRAHFYRLIMKQLIHSLDELYTREDMSKSGLANPDVVLTSKYGNGYDNAIIVRFKITTCRRNLNFRARQKLEYMRHHNYRMLRRYRHLKRAMRISILFYRRTFTLQYHVEKIFHLPSLPIL